MKTSIDLIGISRRRVTTTLEEGRRQGGGRQGRRTLDQVASWKNDIKPGIQAEVTTADKRAARHNCTPCSAHARCDDRPTAAPPK